MHLGPVGFGHQCAAPFKPRTSPGPGPWRRAVFLFGHKWKLDPSTGQDGDMVAHYYHRRAQMVVQWNHDAFLVTVTACGFTFPPIERVKLTDALMEIERRVKRLTDFVGR